MATAIVTDSNCGIAVDEAETLNIHIIPIGPMSRFSTS